MRKVAAAIGLDECIIQLTGTEKTPTHQRLFGLDHLIALAITFVFEFHYGIIFPHPE